MNETYMLIQVGRGCGFVVNNHIMSRTVDSVWVKQGSLQDRKIQSIIEKSYPYFILPKLIKREASGQLSWRSDDAIAI